jgi:hypothetical protein
MLKTYKKIRLKGTLTLIKVSYKNLWETSYLILRCWEREKMLMIVYTTCNPKGPRQWGTIRKIKVY